MKAGAARCAAGQRQRVRRRRARSAVAARDAGLVPENDAVAPLRPLPEHHRPPRCLLHGGGGARAAHNGYRRGSDGGGLIGVGFGWAGLGLDDGRWGLDGGNGNGGSGGLGGRGEGLEHLKHSNAGRALWGNVSGGIPAASNPVGYCQKMTEFNL